MIQLLSIIAGLVCSTGRSEDFAEAIMFFYNLSEDEKLQFYENAKKATDFFDYKNLTKRLIDIFRVPNKDSR